MKAKRFSTQPVCDSPDCYNKCREGKQYCIDHLEGMSYANRVMQDLLNMEADRKRLNKGEAPLHTFFVEELLNELHSHGPRTAERLARTLNLKSDGVIRLAKYMKRTITHTRRGAKLIS